MVELSDEPMVMWSGPNAPTRVGEPTPMPGSIDFPHRVVSIVEHQGGLFVATEQRIYELVDGVWRPMIFVNGDIGMASGG